MNAFAADWLNLLLRWSHMVAGIAWIGTSFYFIALDLSLRRDGHAPRGVTGTAWEVHGGGFYRVEKYEVAPASLPEHLTWFRWEAYLTWLTGFALLVVQFYLDAQMWLIDPAVMPLASWEAIGISVASLAAGWFAYDILCRSRVGANVVVLACVVFAMIVLATWGYAQVFSASAALLHTGVLVGTIMAFNVFAVIVPNQKKVAAALLAGGAPDPASRGRGQAALAAQHLSHAAGPAADGERPLSDADRPPAHLAAGRAHHRGRRLRAAFPRPPRGRYAVRLDCVDPAGDRGGAGPRGVGDCPVVPRFGRHRGAAGDRRGGAGNHLCPLRVVPRAGSRPIPRSRQLRRTWCWRPPTICAAMRTWSICTRSVHAPCRSET